LGLEVFICEFAIVEALFDVEQEVVDLMDQVLTGSLWTLYDELVADDVPGVVWSREDDVAELLLCSEVVEEWFIQVLHHDFVHQLQSHGGRSNFKMCQDARVFIG